ncbi:uncharacterized protein TNCV_2015171 [Trichonephila clavipes]|nr:uncharacterized protein TNCV_2015171 [Trichonephila clavipes]
MRNDFYAEIDNDNPIEAVTFSNALQCLKTVETCLMQQGVKDVIFTSLHKVEKELFRPLCTGCPINSTQTLHSQIPRYEVAAVAKWYRYRIVACLVTSSSPVPLKTRRVGQRCTLNMSRAETSSRWCGVVVRRRGASSGVVHVT